MKTTDLCRKSAISVTTLAVLSGPAFAQSERDRVAELEKQMMVLAEQLSELRAELDTAVITGWMANIESLRNDVVANEAAISAIQSATKYCGKRS